MPDRAEAIHPNSSGRSLDFGSESQHSTLYRPSVGSGLVMADTPWYSACLSTILQWIRAKRIYHMSRSFPSTYI